MRATISILERQLGCAALNPGAASQQAEDHHSRLGIARLHHWRHRDLRGPPGQPSHHRSGNHRRPGTLSM